MLLYEFECEFENEIQSLSIYSSLFFSTRRSVAVGLISKYLVDRRQNFVNLDLKTKPFN